jgi:DNA-binding MarR family transcriptional regulator
MAIVGVKRKEKLTPRQKVVLNELIKLEKRKSPRGIMARLYFIADKLKVQPRTIVRHLNQMVIHGVVEHYFSGFRVVSDKLAKLREERTELQEHLSKISDSFRLWHVNEDGYSLSIEFEGLTKEQVFVITDMLLENFGSWLGPGDEEVDPKEKT